MCSDYPEAAVVQNSDPQNDSVLLYDEVSGGLRALEEGEFNCNSLHCYACVLYHARIYTIRAWYIPYAYMHMVYSHTRMVRIIVPYTYGAYETTAWCI